MNAPHPLPVPQATATAAPAPIVEPLRRFPVPPPGGMVSEDVGQDDPARQTFLALLEALTHPGRVVELAGLETADDRPMPAAAALAVLGQLRDRPEAVWLGPGQRRPPLQAWLSTHTAARCVATPDEAVIGWVPAAQADAALWQTLGRRQRPHLRSQAATPLTLLIEVPGLLVDPPPPKREPGDLELRPRLRIGQPGRCRETRMAVDGLSRHFWRMRERAAQEPVGPRPVLLLLCDHRLAAIPAEAEVHMAH